MELIASFEFTTIILGLIAVHEHRAIGPAQEKIGSERKDNGLTGNVGLNAGSLGGGGQTEVQSVPENYGISFEHPVAGHGMNHLGFEEESDGIGPVESGNVEVAAIRGEAFGQKFGKWARPGNTRNAGIAELIAFAGVEREGTNSRPPFSVRRTRRDFLA